MAPPHGAGDISLGRFGPLVKPAGRKHGPSRLRLSVELGPDLGRLDSLQDLLSQVVEASGGHAGLLTTWDDEADGTARTSTYKMAPDLARFLTRLVEESPGDLDADSVARIERDANLMGEGAGPNPVRVMALPVRSQDRTVGLLCLLHPSHAAELLAESPGMYSIVIDRVDVVVENARLLQRLLEERQWLEAIVHHSTQGIAIVDRCGRIIGFNLALERLSGWSLDEAVGHPVQDMFPVRLDTGAADAEQMSLLEEGRATAQLLNIPNPLEGRLRTRDGEWVDIEVTGTGVWAQGGAPLGWVVTMRDIRERKERERLQRIFLSGVSHELHTPIAIIKGFAGLMADGDVGMTPAQMREKAAIIFEESERLERMVRQMLEATRLQAGGTRLELESVELDLLVERVVQKMEPLARSRDSAMEIQAPESLPPVMADPARVEQVLTNLLENGLKYGKGRIVVSLRSDEREVEVAVTDSGQGVPEPEKERIFGAFERAREGSRARSLPGAGLGLFICKAIVEAHGGRIGVEKGAGGGARFWFTLPRETP